MRGISNKMSYKPMQGKTAIVTGGAGGIGKAISIKLAQSGGNVVIFGRDIEKGESTVEVIKSSGGNASFFRTDLAVDKEIESSLGQVLNDFGHVDILVNNAAVSGYMGPIVETPIKEVENVLKINLISIFYLCKLVLPKMIENEFGRIINISSVAYRKSPPNSATYNISKGGLNILTMTLSKEVASHGITVNAVAPGLVLTERIIKSRIPGMAEKKGISQEAMMKELTAGTDTGRL
ncbi:MAG: SDR family oxidoreductase, partial [Candidatus Aminicenantes bacterium]|nr:SDR family oxidoreductase [Candidatus Aminicenantes bacterium]